MKQRITQKAQGPLWTASIWTFGALLLLASSAAFAQGNADHALSPPIVPEARLNEGAQALTTGPATTHPSRTVYGWFPTWSWAPRADGTMPPEPTIHWDLLTHISYFSVTQTVTGAITGTSVLNGTAYETIRDQAKQNGVKITITVTNFHSSEIATLVSASTRQTAIDAIISMVQDAGAEGVNMDYEMVPLASKADYTAFMTDLTTQMHTAIPGSHVSLAGPTISARSNYDYDALLTNTDGIIPMFYGCTGSWAGSAAGPLAPLKAGFPGLGTQCNLQWVVDDYLQWGNPENRGKVAMGLPFYGNRWTVASDTVPATPTASGSAVLFRNVVSLYSTQRLWDENSETPFAKGDTNAGPTQTWVDDGESFDLKLQYLVDKDMGGIGIWALGYEGDTTDFWDAIRARFVSSGPGTNHAPVAVISPLQASAVGAPTTPAPITLDGHTSFDLDNDPLRFTWAQASGPTVTLTGAASATTTFTPNGAGTYRFTLTVNDGKADSTPATIGVVVSPSGVSQELPDSNTPPLARATATYDTQLTLDGSDSSDPEGATLTYAWRQISGPPVPLTAAAKIVLQVSESGTYAFGLIVSDGVKTSAEALASAVVSLQAPGNSGTFALQSGANPTGPAAGCRATGGASTDFLWLFAGFALFLRRRR